MVAIMHVKEGRHPFRGLFGDKNVLEFDYQGSSDPNGEFVNNAVSFKPDWIYLQVQETGLISSNSILKVRSLLPRTVITHWMGDARRSISMYLASISRSTHLTLISNIGQIADYKSVGAPRVEYHQVALDWKAAVAVESHWDPPFPVPDVVFCGNHCNPEYFTGMADRLALIKAMVRSGISFGVVGSSWPEWVPVIGSCTVQQQQHIYRMAKVVLSVNNFNDIELYYSDRQLHAMFSGTPVVCKYIPGLEREFKDGKHCMFYSRPDQAVTAARTLLADRTLSETIGREGRAEVVRNHTFFSRVISIFPVIEEISTELHKQHPEEYGPMPAAKEENHRIDRSIQRVRRIPPPPPSPRNLRRHRNRRGRMGSRLRIRRG